MLHILYYKCVMNLLKVQQQQRYPNSYMYHLYIFLLFILAFNLPNL